MSAFPVTELQSDTASAQALCMACGLCCDGTLFGSVPLAPEDDAAALEAAGIETLVDKGRRIFNQPCTCYQKRVCAIYQARPLTCRTFQCKLLKQYERREISYEQAQDRIAIAVRHRDDVRAQLEAALSPPWPNGVGRIADVYMTWEKTQIESDPAGWAQRNQALLFNYGALLYRLKRFFGTQTKKEQPL